MKTNQYSKLAAVFSALPMILFTSSVLAAGEAKNVVFFLGDGMGPTTVTAARIYKYGEAGKLHMESLPRTARIKTFSNDAQTTDSAPSMSAYMTGVKMNNEVISMSTNTVADKAKCTPENGAAVPTLLELAKGAGKAVGAVTTTEATHATPAATYAHICHRDLSYNIAAQLVPGGSGYNSALGNGPEAGLNVLFGGGRKAFVPVSDASAAGSKGRPDGRDLLTELAGKGFIVARDRASFETLPNSATKVIGIFSDSSHMKFELDRVKDPPASQQPSLSEMTVKALDVLAVASAASGNKGFFLMVEGGRIDHALHGTNAKRALEDTIAFDNAIAAALAKVNLQDTLVVVTADHDHTMVFNGYSKRGNPILDVVRGLDGNPAKDADNLSYPTLVFGNGPGRANTRVDVTTAETTADDFLQPTSVRLPSETHGGGDVMLMATGAGSASFKGTLENARVFGLVKKALGF
jgi:alkaline phosphatase